ncbi:MAG: bifunctional (p)ppGpp synthetase/guanosine-3',5'-bis(diphosphate) 3'-pyrophosphohydrolase [Rubrivivax sp.]|nr:bifunctional (p)ppGpp synthetase/guanosine-3',5'-bis(diphosphate) 3'-pyrophosphohydrolase [Rubrivivax sp.]
MGIRSFAAELLPSALNLKLFGFDVDALPLTTPSSFAELTERLSYLGKSDLKLVREAFKFADEAHLGQFRASGEPYITHPVAVAGLCAAWRMDVQAIMAALMHDAMEDCGITKPALIERFGAPTAELVDGLTKLDKLHFNTREEGQAESFRKMLLAMSRDVRVILVKLADRLHNMRTMEAMAPNKRQRIARETLDIFAPIAHRLGLNQVYRELQDLSFAHLHPWRHAVLAKALERARGHRRDIVERVRKEVEKAFAAQKLKVELSGREKTTYSIYRKMREKHDGFASVNDIFGFRVIVPEVRDCYWSLGILHQQYKPMPGRFKDYIAIPKPNGYQSLHTTVISPLGTAVEFQMRTEAMHAVAEKGIAAHWMYKVDPKGQQSTATLGADAQKLGALWLQSLMDIQDDTRDSAEFLEHVKFDLVPEAVYVFTPKSKILALPWGATPIDFAYAIHSDVGDHTVAAKVNGEPVPLRTALNSGDVVEVITAPGARPNPGWLNSVRTGRARSKIRHHLKTMEAEESRALGEQMLAQALRAEGLVLPSAEPGDAAAAALWQQLSRISGNRGRNELLVDIGLGRKVAVIVAKRLAQMMAERGARPDAVALTLGRFSTDDGAPTQGAVFIDGSHDTTVRLATCCHPIPGDTLAGYLGRGEGLLVHTAECRVGRKLFGRDSERWLHVEWAEETVRSFEAGVVVQVHNGKGVLAQVAQAVAQAEADITHLNMGEERASDSAELQLLLSVRDRVHLADVMRSLRRQSAVMKVWRVKP